MRIGTVYINIAILILNCWIESLLKTKNLDNLINTAKFSFSGMACYLEVIKVIFNTAKQLFCQLGQSYLKNKTGYLFSISSKLSKPISYRITSTI